MSPNYGTSILYVTPYAAIFTCSYTLLHLLINKNWPFLTVFAENEYCFTIAPVLHLLIRVIYKTHPPCGTNCTGLGATRGYPKYTQKKAENQASSKSYKDIQILNLS